MGEFYGDLCIGGLLLRHLHGELEEDGTLDGSSDHLLAGRLELSEYQRELLQFGRLYRLQLDDGRAGQVVVSKEDGHKNDTVVVEFQPANSPNKPR